MPRRLTAAQRIQRGQEGAIRRYGHLSVGELRERAAAGKINPHVAMFLLSRAKVTEPDGSHSTSLRAGKPLLVQREWRGHSAGDVFG